MARLSSVFTLSVLLTGCFLSHSPEGSAAEADLCEANEALCRELNVPYYIGGCYHFHRILLCRSGTARIQTVACSFDAPVLDATWTRVGETDFEITAEDNQVVRFSVGCDGLVNCAEPQTAAYPDQAPELVCSNP